jgi:ABC-type uncharacterized transport system substrate-binding protein
MHARRQLLVLGAAALAWPLVATAQPKPRVWRLGYLAITNWETSGHYYAAFRDALRGFGYVEGKNLVIEWRFAGTYDRLPALARELVSLNLDVVVGSSTPAVAALKGATATLPIVMGVSIDPVGAGFVQSLARPGGNITGSTVAWGDYSAKQLELLQRIVSKLTRVGVLLNPGNPSHAGIVKTLQGVATTNRIAVIAAEARNPREIEASLESMARQRVGALIVLPDAFLLAQRRQLADLEAKHRMPTMHQLPEHVEAGGLMSYGQDVIHNHRLAAIYVDRIFRGARPGDLPVEQTSKLELVINGKTAKALGLSIPPDVKVLADRVID